MMHCNAHSCTWHGNYILRIGVVGSCVTMQHCTSNTKLRDTSHSYAIGWYGAICTILVYFFFLISHIFLCVFFFSLLLVLWFRHTLWAIIHSTLVQICSSLPVLLYWMCWMCWMCTKFDLHMCERVSAIHIHTVDRHHSGPPNTKIKKVSIDSSGPTACAQVDLYN